MNAPRNFKELDAVMPEIYREHKTLCRASKQSGIVRITAIRGDKSADIHGGSVPEAFANLIAKIGEWEKECANQ
jgi:hypothetical protein